MCCSFGVEMQRRESSEVKDVVGGRGGARGSLKQLSTGSQGFTLILVSIPDDDALK